jgi:STE24 endopeptidase
MIACLLSAYLLFAVNTPPSAAQASRHFDAQTATEAWLATVSPSAKAKSDAYFDGSCWLTFWDFVCGITVALILLETKLSARMRDLARRVTGLRWLQSFFYWIEFSIFLAVLTFPLTLYEDFVREHKYGLSNQNFTSWFRDQLVELLVLIVLGGMAFVILMSIVRKFPHTWHLWGIAAGTLFTIIAIMITPVFIAPLFNTYTPLQNAKIKNQILSLARANGIAVSDVYEVNASRQSKRVSANVSGFLGTERITLNDNLLNRCSPEAIMATMGHEIGHYVMHHILTGVMFSFIAILVMFVLLRWALERALGQWGIRWQIRGIEDIAVLPLAMLILSSLSFLFMPVANTFSRMQEYEADLYGLNASRQPDGEAEVDLLLGEYRKLDPGPVEEFIFFDHPSGRGRIYAAMRWKAENLCLFDPSLPCRR